VIEAAPGKKIRTPYLENTQHSQVPVAHACNPSYSGGRDPGESWFEASPGQIVYKALSQKNPSHPQKKTLVEWLKW
jgi:hypothetical protein